ncbi:MAG: hypothetical protein ACOYEP_04680 [Limnochordia bacterium]
MRQLWRSGFGRDLARVVFTTIVVGSLIAGGLSVAVDRYFTSSVNHLVGDYGEYDLIVHAQEETHEAFFGTLKGVIDKHIPGARIKRGPTVAGKAHFLIAVDEQNKTSRVFESLDKWMSDLPGYAGLTFITEPSVVMRNVHPGMRKAFADELTAMEGVRFVFRNGTSLVAVVDTPERVEEVYKAAQQSAARYSILEVRFPFEHQAVDFDRAAMDVEKALQGMWGKDAVRDVSVMDQQDEMDSFVVALHEMRRFLLGYATQAEVRLTTTNTVRPNDLLELAQTPSAATRVLMRVTDVTADSARGYIESGDATALLTTGAGAYLVNGDGRRSVGWVSLTNERLQLVEAIDTSLELLDQLQGLADDAQGAVTNAETVLTTFEAALVQLDEVQEQVRQINEELTAKSTIDPGEILVSVLLSGVMKRLQQQDTKPPDLENIDVPGMRAALQQISDRLEAMAALDVTTIKREISRVRDNLPQLSDGEIADSLRLIDRYLEGQVVPGDRLQYVVDEKVDADQSAALIRTVLKRSDVSLFTSPAALVNPDARATLFGMLAQVRRTIAGIMALVLVLLALIADQATVFSAVQVLRQMKGRSGRRLSAEDVYAALVGALLLAGMYVGSGAAIPAMSVWWMLPVGALLGLFVSRLSRRISPVDADEIVAAEALGLDAAQLMREVVVPSSRPGLLWLLNRTQQVFR